MAATSTYMTFLMHKNGEEYEKLIDITEFPDLGTDPEMLETTTLSDRMRDNWSGTQFPLRYKCRKGELPHIWHNRSCW